MSLPRPVGHTPAPKPKLADVARTARGVALGVVPNIARLALHGIARAPSTNDAAGLHNVRTSFTRTLRLLGIDLDVLDADRVPAAGGIIFMWNQESHLDHLVLASAIPRPFVSLYNNAVARVPFYGAHMRDTGHVHVDRTDEAQWRRGVARAADMAREGTCVLVSPEGTRSWDGKLLPMKRGAFILAAMSARPIVCVTVIGGHERLPRGSVAVRAGTVRVVFSDPIETTGHDVDECTRLMPVVAKTFDDAKRAHALTE